jgi:pSer/pThr/pTyr-binding forkhead associated (FHA) protein
MAKALKLRFVAGKYEGGEFRLPAEGEVIVGRGAELPVVLAEDMVSRKHARLLIQGEQIRIEDLGSTNGTFVNGERVKTAEVHVGDRILIGTSIMKVLAVDVPETRPTRGSAGIPTARSMPTRPAVSGMPPPPGGATAHMTIPPASGPDTGQHEQSRLSTGSVKTVAGSIEEIPLPDILQLFAASRKTGLLVVKSAGGRRGNLHIENGQVVCAQFEGVAQCRSRKTLSRVLRWKAGTFELRPAKPLPAGDRLTEPMEHLLMDGLRELDEIERLRPDLPEEDSPLDLVRPLKPKLRDLLPSTMDILQAVHNEGTLVKVMDAFPDMSDLDVAMEVVLLIQKGYVTASK